MKWEKLKPPEPDDPMCCCECDLSQCCNCEEMDEAFNRCCRINSCVGQANHRSFLLTLGLFLVTSVYGMSLVLRSICPGQYVLTAAFYCPGVYSNFSTALCFTCVWYSGIITAGLFYLMVVQLLNISFNVTEREAQLALRNGTGHWRLCGLVLVTREHSLGFTHNWLQFLTMTHSSSPSTHTVLV